MIHQKNYEKKILRQKEVLRSRGFLRIYQRFIKIRGNPREIALGFSLGLFIALSPTMGFQIIIAVFLAALFGWNKITAGMGVWITNPLTAPFIYSGTYVLGAGILGLENQFIFSEGITFTALVQMIKEAPNIFAALTTGGIIAGVPLALVGYYVIYSLVKKYQDDLKKALEKQKLKHAERKQRRKMNKKSAVDKRMIQK
jgi:uncharacterized protein (DUF2062 family)